MRTFAKSFALLLACLGLAAVPRPGHAATGFYHLASAVILRGKSPAWDYLTFDAGRGYLFIGRRHAGVTVYAVASGCVVTIIADSAGADKAILVPSLDRGYTVNRDGSTTEFDLESLKTVRRIRLPRTRGGQWDVTCTIIHTMRCSAHCSFPPLTGKQRV